MASIYQPNPTPIDIDQIVINGDGNTSLSAGVLSQISAFLLGPNGNAGIDVESAPTTTTAGVTSTTINIPSVAPGVTPTPILITMAPGVSVINFSDPSGVPAVVVLPTGQVEFFDPSVNTLVQLGPGDDTVIMAGGSHDTVQAYTGASTISDANNYDVINGSTGTAVITVTGNDDTVTAGTGLTSISLGSGTGNVYYAGGRTTITGASGGAGSESLYGSTVAYARDYLWGGSTSGQEIISLASENVNSDDYVRAGSNSLGTASIYGGAGQDTLVSGKMNTFISAGSGNNFLWGGRFGASGNALSSQDTLYGGSGNDTLYVYAGSNTLVAGTGPNTLEGGSGDMVVGTANFGKGDLLEGNTSTLATSHATIIGDTGTATETLEGGFSALSDDSLWGGTTTGNESISLFNGNNYARAGYGNATMTGGSGTDHLVSGRGDTSMVAGSGTEYLWGGRFGATVVAGQTVQLQDTLIGGSGNDSLYVYTGNNLISAGSGNTTIDTGMGRDSVSMGTGNDTVNLTVGSALVTGGSSGSDTVNFGGATAMDDTINGGNANVIINIGHDEQLTSASVNNGTVTLNFTNAGTVQTLTFNGTNTAVHFDTSSQF